MRMLSAVLLLFTFTSSWAQELSKDEFSLIQAAESGKSAEVLTLLEKGVRSDCAGWDGMTPLHYAVQNGHLNVAKILILNGAKVNPTDIDDRTPLLLAVHFNQLDIAEFLMQQGGDPNIRDLDGLSPLFYAAAYGDYFMTDMFLFYEGKQDVKDQTGKNPFLAAVWGGFPAIARLLLNYGAELRSGDQDGNNALMLAVMNQDTVMADSLLAWGIDIHQQNQRRHTALELALQSQDSVMVQKLLNAGADPNHEIQKGFTTLDYAKSTGVKSHLIDQLQKAGAVEAKGIFLNYGNLGIDSRFNFEDHHLGLQLEVLDIKKNFGVYTGLYQRPGRLKTYYPMNDSSDFQFRETRTFLVAGVRQLFPLVVLKEARQWGFAASLDASVSLGDFKGSGIRPPAGFALNPSLALYFATSKVRYQAGYLYHWSSLKQSPPGYFFAGMTFSLTRRPY